MNTTDEPIVLERRCRRTECTSLASRLFLAMVELVFDFIYDFYHAPYWVGYIYVIRKRIRDLIEAMQARKNYILYLPGFIRTIRETGNILLSEFRDIYTKMVQIMFPCAHACTTGSFIVMDRVIYLAFVYEIQGDHLLIMLQSDKKASGIAPRGYMRGNAIPCHQEDQTRPLHVGTQWPGIHRAAR
jgi:hypothetical protein